MIGTTPRRGVFLDLNGTLVMPVQVHHPQEYTILPRVVEAVRLLNAHGFACPVVTIQSRIGKKLYSADEFALWFTGFQEHLAEQGAIICGPYVCPHRFQEPCLCKKPAPYLYLQAANELGILPSKSVTVGDTVADVRAAQSFGGLGCLVRTGWGERALSEHRAAAYADHVAADILEAAQWVIGLAV